MALRFALVTAAAMRLGAVPMKISVNSAAEPMRYSEVPWAKRAAALANSQAARGRELGGTTCTPITTNGVWSGSPPAYTKCGYFTWTSPYTQASSAYYDTSVTSSYSLACNTGYFLTSGSPTTNLCTATYYCWSLGTSATCSSVCKYTYDTTNCDYCCVCTLTFAAAATTSTCATCDPTAAAQVVANAINPALVPGTSTYTWTCALGFYGGTVTRTCAATGGAAATGGTWSGSALACTACPVPASPANGQKSTPVAGTFTYQCNAGYYNPVGSTLLTLQCNNLATSAGTALTTTVGVGTTISCSPCAAPYYCTGTQPATLCPAGTYGAIAQMTTSACQGQCFAGYYCPVGSTSGSANPCGGVGVYCPAGSGAPVTVVPGSFSIPLAAPVTLRTGQQGCPANRLCSGGVIQPGIDMSVSCAGGKMNMVLSEATSGDQGPQILYTMPGSGGGLTVLMAVTAITGIADANCSLTNGQFAFNTASGTYALTSTAPQLVYANCPNGFTLQTTATRSDSATSVGNGFGAITTTCAMTVTVLQLTRPPVITDCSARSVPERSLIGAAIGNPVGATNPNIGTSLLFSINNTLSGNPPVSIGMCDGTIRVLSNIVWATLKSFKLYITITNNGAAIGLGSSSVTCIMPVNVTMVPLPPALTTTTFTVAELMPVNTWVGNVGAVDPNNFTVTSLAFGSTATPNDFALDSRGNINTTAVIDTIALQKTVWTYLVNASNAYTQSSTPVTINVQQVPRPPVVQPQFLSAPENIAAGVALTGPALQASQPQGLNFTFAVTPTTYFNATPAGVVYRTTTGSITYNGLASSNYTITATIVVTDSAGLVATAPLVVTIIEVNWPPVFTFYNYNYTVAEGAALGTAVAFNSSAPSSTDRNLLQTHTYQVLSSLPAIGASTFTLNAFTAELDVGGSALGATGGALLYDSTQTYPRPQTYQLNLQVADNGLPIMYGAATAWVQVVQIRPRFIFPVPLTTTYNLPGTGAATVGYVAISCAAITWTPLSRATLLWSMSADPTAEGGTVFTLDPVSGNITIANTTYFAATGGNVTGSGTAIGWGPPLYNYNTRNAFNVNVTATQTADGTTRTISLVVLLAHVNRPPVWLPAAVPYAYAPASMNVTVGLPLSTIVYDPDVALNLGENFTFAIVGGNSDNSFAVDPYSGQLSVVNASSFSMKIPDGTAHSPPGFFNLSVSVTDAGIDGPRYTARGWVYINITANMQPPTLTYTVMTVKELVPVGTYVGTVAAVEADTTRHVFYSLVPRGANVNRPFPFNVSTVAVAGTQNAANITVISATPPGPVDYNAFPAYNCTLTACNDNPVAPVCVSAPLDIVVQWVPTAPFFSPNTATVFPWLSLPATAVFYLSTLEHALPSSLIGPAPVVGSSRDASHVLHYSWPSGSFGLNNSVVFAIDQNTGNVSVNPTNVLNLDVNTQISYYLTAQVLDTATGLTDTARVVVTIIDINDPAVFTGPPRFSFQTHPGLYAADNATLLPGWTFNCSEAAATGAVLGYVRAIDEDRMNPLWGQTNYALVSGPDSAAFFLIDPKSGLVTVAPGAALNFWDQTSYTFNVTCTDGDIFNTPITVAQTITVQLLQVNTVAVTGFYVAPTIAPSLAINASGSMYAATLPMTQVLHATTGSTPLPIRIYITGSGFGPTARRQGLFPVVYTVSAKYGNAFVGTYVATSCQVEAPNTLVSCLVAAGAGHDLNWQVTVTVTSGSSPSTWTSTGSALTTSYFPPAVSAVTSGALLATAGGGTITVTGTNVGPAGTQVLLAYGSAALGSLVAFQTPVTAPCVYAVPQTTVTCTAVPGVGSNLSFTLIVAQQSSVPFSATTVAYAPPAVTAVVSSVPLLDTVGSTGGQTFTVTGTNFGPLPTLYPAVAAAMPLGVTYSQNFSNPAWFTVFSAAGCTMTAAHTVVVCTPADGIGNALQVAITVGGQLSAPSAATIAYQPPTIVNVSGPALADTLGGDGIVLSGWQFGPLTPVDGSGDALPGFLQPVAAYGHQPASASAAMNYTAVMCRVSVPSVQGVSLGQMRCVTAPGCGANLVWRVTIGGQLSPVFGAQTTTYHPPIVASYSGPGADYSGAGTALTQGGLQVVIDGKSFGPATCPINLVTYGSDVNSTQFTATGCTMTTPQTDITCYTAVGAGAGLKWRVTIDGQLSVTPSTDYGPPQVFGFSGPATVAPGANPDGGDIVIVTGNYFSVPAFLQSVSYGPSGTEYNVFPGSPALAAAYPPCALTTNHTVLTCTTLPGTGRALQWVVTVGGQSVVTSAPLTTSYAPPTITSITPSHLPTDGGVVHINGTNFGVLAGASLVVLFNSGAAIARPTDAQLTTHYSNVYAGVAGVTPVTQWLKSMRSLLPSAVYTYGRGVNGLDVAIPEGFGYFREVIVVAGGVPSYVGGAFGFTTGASLVNAPTWPGVPTLNFDAPVITNIAPDFQFVNYSAGQLRVQVDGTSFCNVNAYPGCGTVTLTVVPTVIGNQPIVQVPLYTQLPTNVMYPNPWNTTLPPLGLGAQVSWGDGFLTFWMQQQPQNTNLSLVVTVNGVSSPTAYFSKPVPSINALVGQDTLYQNNWNTLGGQPFFIAGVLDVADDIIHQTIFIAVGGRNCPINYDPSQTRIDNGLIITDPAVSYTIVCTMPPGVGIGQLNPVLLSSSAGQSSLASGLQIQYAPPRIDSQAIVTPYLPPAAGSRRALASPGNPGPVRLLASPGNPGPVPTLGALITVSGQYFGLNASGGSPILRAGPPGFLLPCTLVSRSDSLLVAQLPPGDGLGNQLVFTVGEQNNTAVTFDYAAPTVMATVPAVGPGVGGTSISVLGYNFGISGQLTALPGAQPPKPMPWVAIGAVGGPGVSHNCTITSPLPAVNHSALTCTLPEGQGALLPVSLWVNGQLSLAPAPTFSYLPPAVASITPATGPTSGRTPGVFDPQSSISTAGGRIVACVTGTNLGRSGFISFNVTASSGPLSSMLVVNNSEVLPVAAFTYLLQAAGGNVSAVPGMSLSDAQIAALWPSAAAPTANASNASTPSGSVSFSTSLYTLGVQTAPLVGRMWNETQIWFLLPPGLGANLLVSVFPDQPGSSVALFSYNPPTISRVVNADYKERNNNCNVTVEPAPLGFMARQRNVTSRNITVWPGCYPTAGGFTLMLVGDGFGVPSQINTPTMPLAYQNNFGVTIGGVPCMVKQYTTGEGVTSDANHLFCSVAPGYGSNLPVLAEAGGRSSTLNNASYFSFDPPSVSYFDPNNPDALGIPLLGIAGANFGSAPTATTLLINTLPCAPPASGVIWQATDFLYCVPQPDVVGAKNVTIYIANSSYPAQVLDVEEQLIYTCKTNFYGVEGEVCLPCPVGASCPGDERFVDLVNSTAGFWRENATLPSSDVATFCAPQRIITRAYPGGPGCPVMQPCSPSESCLGNNTCAYGYVDDRCVDCLPGLFYRVNGACVKCPDNLYLLYAGLGVILLLVMGAGYFLAKKNVNLAIIAVGVDYFQVVSLFAKANIRWPSILTSLFTWLSVFNLNLDIVAPECLNPGISYQAKWMFIEGMPLLLSAIFCFIFSWKLLYKLACTTKTDKRALYAHAPTLVSTIIVVFRVLFLYLTRTSMDVMTCLPTTPPQCQSTDPNNCNPVLYMAGLITYPCWQGWHLILFPMGLGTMTFYSMFLPIAVGWWLRRNASAVKYDQLLRAKDMGDDTLTNPKYYRFRKMWSKLYQNYRPGKFYWELCIIARKFCIALTALAFVQVASYQMAMCLLVLFVAFVLHTQNLPYMTHDNKPRLVEEHLAKALAGDKTHSMMESEMRAVEKKNIRKRTRQNVFQHIVATKTKDLSALVFIWIFDANTVEAILLASAILVNLSGIMFDSSRFAGNNYYIYYNEYTGIAVGVVLLIVLTILYYVTTIVLELTVLFCPSNLAPLIACLAVCFKSFGKKKVQEAAIKAAQAKGKAVGAATATASDMQVNPFMMKNGGALDDPAFTAAGVVDPVQVGKIDAPTPLMWRAVQSSYGKVHGMLNNMQDELKGLKRDVADGGGGDGGGFTGGAAARGATRTQFKPVVRNVVEVAADGSDMTLSANPLAGGARGGGGAGVGSMSAFGGRAAGLRLATAKRGAKKARATVTDADGGGDDEETSAPGAELEMSPLNALGSPARASAASPATPAMGGAAETKDAPAETGRFRVEPVASSSSSPDDGATKVKRVTGRVASVTAGSGARKSKAVSDDDL